MIYANVVLTVAFDLDAAHRRECPADTGKYNSEIIIYFRSGGNSGARVASIYFLFNGDSRRNSLDGLYIRFGHSSEKLSRI